MSDATIGLKEEAAGTKTHDLDAESLGGSPPKVRERIQVAGATLAEIARVLAANLGAAEYGLGVRARERTNGTGAVTAPATSNVNATLLAANADRIGALVVNDSVQTLYVKFGATAAAGDHTVALYARQSFVVPPGYTGRIDGILDAGTGTARVTEW